MRRRPQASEAEASTEKAEKKSENSEGSKSEARAGGKRGSVSGWPLLQSVLVVWPYVEQQRGYKVRVFGCALLVTVSEFCKLYITLAYKALLDAVSQVSSEDVNGLLLPVLSTLLWYLGMKTAEQTASCFLNYLLVPLLEEVGLSVGVHVLRHAHALPPSYLQGKSTGELSSLVSTSRKSVKDFLYKLVYFVLGTSIQGTLTLLALLQHGWRFVAMVFVTCASYMFISSNMTVSLTENRVQMTSQERQYDGDITDAFLNLHTTRVFGAESYQLARLSRTQEALQACIYRHFRGITILALLQELNQFLQRSPVADSGVEVVFQEGQLQYDAVSLSYGEGLAVMDISFRLPGGSFTGLVGSTGAGKSSVLRALFGFPEVKSGRILIDGQDVSRCSQSSLWSLTGYVPQSCALYRDTIRANITLAAASAGSSPDELEERMHSVCRIADIHDFVETLPEGYDTQLADQGSSISGGQRQRIAIARALFRQPRILVFDEPFSALGAETSQSILLQVREHLPQMTFLLVTHKLLHVTGCDTLLVFDGGRLVAKGSHDALLSSSDVYASMWNAQPTR